MLYFSSSKAMRVFLAIHNIHHDLYKLEESDLPFSQSEYSARVGESVDLSKDMCAVCVPLTHCTLPLQTTTTFLLAKESLTTSELARPTLLARPALLARPTLLALLARPTLHLW